jgi:uncharacterized protein (TIGR04255 family)
MDNVDKKGILKRAPLFYVLTATRFQSLELLPKWIPEIQNALRERLPVFNKLHLSQGPVGVQGHVDGPDFDPEAPTSSWLFSRADRTLTVQISKASLVVHTRNYLTFKDFLAEVEFAYDAVMSQAKQVDVVQVGIRYLDLIDASDSGDLRQYVNPAFLALDETFVEGGEAIASSALTTYKVDGDVVRVSFATGTEVLSVPEDLLPPYLTSFDLAQIAAGAPVVGKLKLGQATLDTDAAWQAQGSERMNFSDLAPVLSRLHDRANSMFRNICSDKAFADWQGEP